jgi:hypothetical protein
LDAEQPIASFLKPMLVGGGTVNAAVIGIWTAILCVMPERNYLLFRNALFLGFQSEEDIGRWFVGGDCLGWIYARLLPRPDLRDVCCPVMEDWGWYASVATRDIKVEVELLLYSYLLVTGFLDFTNRARSMAKLADFKIKLAEILV